MQPNVQTYTSAIIVLAHNEQVRRSSCTLAIRVFASADPNYTAQQQMS